VKCGRCGWRRLFNAGSEAASESLASLSRRLVCSHCGARTPVMFGAEDERTAERWLRER
jgi:ribosomal protein S27AE